MSECVFVPDWPGLPAHIGALSTLRSGGFSPAPYDDSNGSGGFNLGAHVGDDVALVGKNRAQLRQFLPADPQWLTQVHGNRVVDLDQFASDFKADACLSAQAGVVCAVQTADCLPVLFCDPKSNVVAAAHAGWRGLLDGVLDNTVAQMMSAGAAAENIMAWLGPAIGPFKFEVGAEVREKFVHADPCASAAFKASPQQAGKFYADIYQLARLRLHSAGVRDICGADFCTVTQSEKFYSYRRDGVTGRMASLIWIKAK